MAVAIPDEIKYHDAGVFAVTGGSNHNAEYVYIMMWTKFMCYLYIIVNIILYLDSYS